jgi:hypothetical protein
MPLRITSIKDVNAKLAIIKNRDENIREAYAVYKKAKPKEKKETIISELVNELGYGRSTIYRVLKG